MAINKTKKDHGKRIRPSWDETFMFSALWAACRSSCLYLHTGAVIVNQDKRIIATGYNGAGPRINPNCLVRGCRKDEYGVDFDDKGKSACRGGHAEVHALELVARKDLVGTTMYTLHFPCSACAKQIESNGLAEVVYCKGYIEKDSLTTEIFSEAGIRLRRLDLDIEKCFKIIRRIYQHRR